MTDTPDFRSTVSSIEEEYDSDIFFYSREIDDEGLGALVRAVTDSKSVTTHPSSGVALG